MYLFIYYIIYIYLFIWHVVWLIMYIQNYIWLLAVQFININIIYNI